jgi:cell shape-determining protein MreC
MTSTKINLLLLPLLVSILLSTAGKLKIGKTIDEVFYTILSPIHIPVGYLRQATEIQISFIKSFPKLKQNNKDLISQNARLLSENELLKQTLGDNKTINLGSNFKSVLPVRLTGSIGNNSVASSLPLDKVMVGQPLVFGKILLGTVADIKGSVININPLDSDRTQIFPVHTGSGQKGQYKYIGNTPQITDIPSLAPITFGDYVFTEPGELIPGNLVIGKITKIISAQQEPLQKAQIKLETTLQDSPEGLFIILEP